MGAEGTTARRLFVGLRPPEDEARRLVRRTRPTLLTSDGSVPDGLRIYPEGDLHVTLCFLGAFDVARLPELEGGLRDEVRGLNAPELVISGTGAFPSLDRPRAVWAGVAEDGGQGGRLAGLRNRIVQVALSVGWRMPRAERARPFRPHITLARVRAPGARPAPDLEWGPFARLDFAQHWLPVEVFLFESRPDRPEERYPVVCAVPLVVRPG